MKTFRFERSITVPFPIEKVFEFFSQAKNLEVLTPPWFNLHILTPQPVTMEEGAMLDYRLKVRWVPLRWRSEITTWDPPHVFVDEQRRGPYRYWKHEHRFVEVDGGTRVEDHVEYAVLGGSLVNALFVAPDLKKVFDYRETRLAELFAEGSGLDP